LSIVKGEKSNIAGYDMIVFERDSIQIKSFESWNIIINKMLNEMGLI